jgi:pimeloyl-ACP methyl ester carboxylesterase
MLRRRGSSEIPLVLIPGCGRDHHDFDALIEQLPVDVDVVVACLPGRAGIAGTPPASTSSAAAFVRAMLAELSITRAVIGGHSYGGAIALELALDAHEPRFAREAGKAWRGHVSHDDGLRSGLCSGLCLLSTGARLRVHPAVFESVEASGDLVALADWRSCDRFDRIDTVHKIKVPTVVVVGADDVLTPPKYARFLHDQIEGSRLVVVDGAGHEAPTTHPAAVAAAFSPLLRRV